MYSHSLLSLVMCLLVQAQPPATNHKSHKQAPVDIRGTEQSPLVVKTLAVPIPQAQADTAKQERDIKDANDRDLVHFTSWLVVVGAFQLALFFAQLCFLADQAKKLRQTAEAANTSANAANAMAGTMKDTARQQLRAYVYAQGCQIIYRPGTLTLSATMPFKNTGVTPANINSATYDMVLTDMPVPKAIATVDTDVSTTAIGRNADIKYTSRLNLPLSEVRAIEHGRRAIVLYAVVTYVDIFDVTWTTRYKGFITGSDFLSDTEMVPDLCDDGNEPT